MARIVFSIILLISMVVLLPAHEVDFLVSPTSDQNACITINNITQTPPTACGETDGMLEIDAIHESGFIIQYSIDGGKIWRNTATISNLEAGVPYQLQIRDNLGLCVVAYGEIVLENPNCNTNPCVEQPFVITNQPDQLICQGETATLSASAGGRTYAWSPSTGLSADNIANPTATPTATTIYTVTVTRADGCTATDDSTIEIAEGLTISLGADVMICPEEAYALSASGGSSYTWSPVAGLDDPTSPTPTVVLSNSTTYCVTVTNTQGCSDTDCITLQIKEDCEVEDEGNTGQTLNQPCVDDALLGESELCIDASATIAQICIPYPPEELNSTYTISLTSEEPIIVHGCDFSEVYNYQYNFLPKAGLSTNYKIKSWQLTTIIQTGVVNSMQELLSFMQAADPNGNWYLDEGRFSIIGGNLDSVYGDLTITHKNQETILGKNITQLPTGTLVDIDMTDKDQELFTLTDLVTGCTDQILIRRCN